ncbi:MAG: iron-containing alcohol dehydrogenase [Pirellulaceae bacterium]|nr:iron-containing alcohol dehydrogenase [Pirellulaceae bacterium]
MQTFDYSQRTRFVFGAGKLKLLGQLAKELGATRVLIVSDPGVVRAGHFEHGNQSLVEAGIETFAFQTVHPNPSTKDVEAGAKIAREFQPDLIVGLGGGSSMDCAKGINFLYSCGGQMSDYWGIGKATGPMLPMIAIPTTSGTGSEAQSFALISDAKTHVKMACGDHRAACRVAILDPELTLTQPKKVTALTGIDALTHALETYVTKPRTAISMAFSRQAWQALSSSFTKVIDSPKDLEARSNMLLGATIAGMAIEASMLGAAHSLANPITAHFNIPHGQAVGLMMPHVIRFNGCSPAIENDYQRLYLDLVDVGPPSSESSSDALANWFAGQLKHAGLKTHLAELNIHREALPELSVEAAKQWTANFNPRAAGADEMLQIYENALDCRS